jgi:hypothetical protein
MLTKLHLVHRFLRPTTAAAPRPLASTVLSARPAQLSGGFCLPGLPNHPPQRLRWFSSQPKSQSRLVKRFGEIFYGTQVAALRQRS